VESGIKVIGNLTRALVAKPSWRVENSSGTNLVTRKYLLLVNASTIWIKNGFVPTIPRDKFSC
jgi:hypothetical protein